MANPYASPRADVGGRPEGEPSEWQRAKWVFGALWLMLTMLPLLNALFVAPPAPDPWILVANSLLAMAIGIFVARDMWLLKVRRSPLAVDVLAYVLVLGGLAFLIVGKETKSFDWNSLHLDVPIFFLMGAATLGAWITEARKGVRIYVGARHLVFVNATHGR